MSAASAVRRHFITVFQSRPVNLGHPTIRAISRALFSATPACAGRAQAAKFVPDCDMARWKRPGDYHNRYNTKKYFMQRKVIPFDSGDCIW